MSDWKRRHQSYYTSNTRKKSLSNTYNYQIILKIKILIVVIVLNLLTSTTYSFQGILVRTINKKKKKNYNIKDQQYISAFGSSDRYPTRTIKTNRKKQLPLFSSSLFCNQNQYQYHNLRQKLHLQVQQKSNIYCCRQSKSNILSMVSPVQVQNDQASDPMISSTEDTAKSMSMTGTGTTVPVQVSFSHVHMYVDSIDELNIYKQLEQKLNEYHDKQKQISSSNNDITTNVDIEKQQQQWQSIIIGGNDTTTTTNLVSSYIPQGQDIIRQLMVGFGFRITGYKSISSTNDTTTTTTTTRTVLVTSRDPNGVQFLITATTTNSNNDNSSTNETIMSSSQSQSNIIQSETVQRFYNAHNNRPGIGVLGFWTNDINTIRLRYKQYHPNLIIHNNNNNNNNNSIFEVYAFYNNTTSVGTTKNDSSSTSSNDIDHRVPDTGTVLRFIDSTTSIGQSSSSSSEIHDIIGLDKIDTTFTDPTSQAAYCDHWVSNVFDRNEFIDTLYDTLGFTSKVDFNAGVVAAGEAQIESTVIGNTAVLTTSISTDDDDNNNDGLVLQLSDFIAYERALRDQNQVFLPINNALSEVGHVHGFLQELGQGIQHIASRVSDLVAFVQRCNDYRTITNEGFSFLRIPRSYYGVLTVQQLMDNDKGSGVSVDCANFIISSLRKSMYLSKENAVNLDVTRTDIDTVLTKEVIGSNYEMEYKSNKDFIVNTIIQSRYCNLYSLLKDSIDEEQYMGIVRNQILVDIQGNDLLYQIFTSNILQRNPGDEAPFIEFIQRVCSNKKKKMMKNGTGTTSPIIKPGCGGFGIRNFLTLFLSIEVSKAMQEVTDAIDAGDVERQEYAQSMVDCFTMQLNESNPILTYISDAMTDEGECKERMMSCIEQNNVQEMAIWEGKMKQAAERKQIGNAKLMECSSRYKDEMKAIRERRQLVF